MKRIDRTGEVSYNNFGSLMVIKEYRNYNDIDVYFPTHNYIKRHTTYKCFIEGYIKSPYECRTFGKGCLGEGKYKVSENGKRTKYYDVWLSMLTRAYDSKYHDKEPTYIECTVHDSWLNFQTFGEWVDKNYYEIKGQRMELDKDILCKGNKIYSPNTCVFVPQRINSLFTKRDNCRGDLPIGVVYNKSKGKYMACCNMNGKQKTLGYYKNPVEAFQVYKNFKEKHIKEVAEEYKNVIPQKLYDAMMNYQVEIDD